MLGELGYGFAYRVLDAQYFGVPQRRRRVFVVGYSGDWRRAAAVLFEYESLRGDSPPSREAGKGFAADVVPSLTASGRGVERTGESRGQDPVVAVMATGQAGAEIAYNHCPTLNCNHEAPVMSYGIPGNWIGRNPENGGNAVEPMHNVAPCLTKTDIHGVSTDMAVRRLTPTECERLQGFPDGWTKIPYRGKPADQCPDGPRYKALGNSMAVPVMRWIGGRINSNKGVQRC